jgi:prepilin-type N-terminal cleavage/methylation domain-containing protein
MMNRKGFTLIELLIVVVIIGILAAIAIPKFASTKQRAYLTAMTSDLRNLATAQEAFLSASQPPAYATGAWTTPGAQLTDPNNAALVLFAATTGVTVNATAVAGGWSATATHTQAPGVTCAIFIGAAPVTAPATVEGEPRCQ